VYPRRISDAATIENKYKVIKNDRAERGARKKANS